MIHTPINQRKQDYSFASKRDGMHSPYQRNIVQNTVSSPKSQQFVHNQNVRYISQPPQQQQSLQSQISKRYKQGNIIEPNRRRTEYCSPNPTIQQHSSLARQSSQTSIQRGSFITATPSNSKYAVQFGSSYKPSFTSKPATAAPPTVSNNNNTLQPPTYTYNKNTNATPTAKYIHKQEVVKISTTQTLKRSSSFSVKSTTNSNKSTPKTNEEPKKSSPKIIKVGENNSINNKSGSVAAMKPPVPVERQNAFQSENNENKSNNRNYISPEVQKVLNLMKKEQSDKKIKASTMQFGSLQKPIVTTKTSIQATPSHHIGLDSYVTDRNLKPKFNLDQQENCSSENVKEIAQPNFKLEDFQVKKVEKEEICIEQQQQQQQQQPIEKRDNISIYPITQERASTLKSQQEVTTDGVAPTKKYSGEMYYTNNSVQENEVEKKPQQDSQSSPTTRMLQTANKMQQNLITTQQQTFQYSSNKLMTPYKMLELSSNIKKSSQEKQNASQQESIQPINEFSQQIDESIESIKRAEKKLNQRSSQIPKFDKKLLKGSGFILDQLENITKQIEDEIDTDQDLGLTQKILEVTLAKLKQKKQVKRERATQYQTSSSYQYNYDEKTPSNNNISNNHFQSVQGFQNLGQAPLSSQRCNTDNNDTNRDYSTREAVQAQPQRMQPNNSYNSTTLGNITSKIQNNLALQQQNQQQKQQIQQQKLPSYKINQFMSPVSKINNNNNSIYSYNSNNEGGIIKQNFQSEQQIKRPQPMFQKNDRRQSFTKNHLTNNTANKVNSTSQNVIAKLYENAMFKQQKQSNISINSYKGGENRFNSQRSNIDSLNCKQVNSPITHKKQNNEPYYAYQQYNHQDSKENYV